VHIIGHWTYAAGVKKDVFVAANGDAVELFLNGKSLGRGAVSDRYLFTFPQVSWEPGELKAISYLGGKAVATEAIRTAGAPVALRLTPITGPEGLRADGSDVALIDVEAVDAQGERCPTFERPVNFDLSGPGTWRGGYNSGKTNTINQTHLNLECGINRVAVRAGRTPGAITLRARSEGLREGIVKIVAKAFPVTDGFSTELPVLQKVVLPTGGFDVAMADTMPLPVKMQASTTSAPSGQFTQAFSYSGPTHGVRVERDAEDGKKIYADRAETFANLPTGLRGSDYVQAASADESYNAVDLMEVAVKDGAMISVAYDVRSHPPEWLTRQFKASDLKLTINGQGMSVFQHRASGDESVTLGANNDSEKHPARNMYVVFVSGPMKQEVRR
jgi:beta-galactosidase